jgi:D-ribulokinase
MDEAVFLGVDVGTGSARVGFFTAFGELIASEKEELKLWREAGDVVEQSSEDVWNAVARAAKRALGTGEASARRRSGRWSGAARLSPNRVRGIGFDATCSLVVLGPDAEPLPVGPSGDPQRNIIVWMDHRALDQAERINATADPVLDYVGGAVSPEMQTPKLLWLKEHLPQTYGRAAHFLDLTDYLTFRATGSLARSVCTVGCKWTYLAHEHRWSDNFLQRIGLGDLAADGHRRIGSEIVQPGTRLAGGLSEAAARDLGLLPGTPVGAGLIDAHAGGIGTIGGRSLDGGAADPQSRIAFIMGTSNCTMAVAPEARFVNGVWGPYFDAMIPGLWLAEGGQSAAGAAIDHLVRLHPAFPALAAEAKERNVSPLDMLEKDIVRQAPDLSEAALLAADLHVLPEFLGNRSPFADPEAKAVIAGLALDDSRDSLARLYLAGLCGLAYGSAQILEALAKSGYRIETIVMSGGASRSELVRQITADATGLSVALPATPEPVLLGAAMLGAVAAGAFPSLGDAMQAMSRDALVTRPAGGRIGGFHAAKREIFEAMQALERQARSRMGLWREG